MCPNVFWVLTKTDFYPAWRKILELDVAHLADAKIQIPVLPVSSPLHVHAAATADAELDDESGFPVLLDTLRRDVIGNGEQRGVSTACAIVLDVVAQLESGFRSEKQALEHPANAAEQGKELERARGARGRDAQARPRAGHRPSPTASATSPPRSTTTCVCRFRRVIQEADDAIDESDPMDLWDEFEPWLYRRVAEDVVGNFGLLQQLTRRPERARRRALRR